MKNPKKTGFQLLIVGVAMIIFAWARTYGLVTGVSETDAQIGLWGGLCLLLVGGSLYAKGMTDSNKQSDE